MVPPELHTFAVLSAFGGLFGRRVRIAMGSEHAIDTTQSVILVSPSGQGKGLAIRAATKAIGLANSGYKIVGGKATMEGILSRLDPLDGRALMVAPELGAMFGKQKFRANFDTEMTDLMDNGDEYLWQTAGNRNDRHEGVLRNVAVTLLSATVMKWLLRCMPGTALAEGFASRMLWVRVVREPKKVPFPRAIKEMPGLIKVLQDWYTKWILRREPWIIDLEHDKDSSREYLRWYDQHFEEMPQGNPWERGGWNRRRSLYLQVALVLSISEAVVKDAEPRLSVQCMKAADHLVRWCEPGTKRILGELGGSERQELKLKVLSKLSREPGGAASEARIHKKVAYHTDTKDGTLAILNEMRESGWVIRGPVDDKGTLKKGWRVTAEGAEVLA